MRDYIKQATDSIRYVAENIVVNQRIERAAREKGLPVDDLDWEPCHYSGLTLTLLDVDREEFRSVTAKVSAVLGPPDITTGKADYRDRFQVTAKWTKAFMVSGKDDESGFELDVKIVAHPKDCKLAEVEEVLPAVPERTVKVLKPHPECVAAMRELEESL